MRNLVTRTIIMTAVVAAIGWLGPQPAARQAQAYRAPRLIVTQNPDLNGIWQALNTAN
jgi:hypothetical protein